MKKLLIGGLLGAAGLAAWLSRDEPDDAPLRSVLWIGDSQTQASHTFGRKVADRLRSAGYDVDVVARNGWGLLAFRSKKVAGDRYLPTLIASQKPDVLVVGVGGNDAALGPSDSAYKHAVRDTLRQAWEAGVRRVIWLGPSWVDDDVVKAKRGIEGYAGKRARIQRLVEEAVAGDDRVTVLTQSNHTAQLERPDGLHYTGAAYTAWADKATPEILSALA